MKQSNEMKHYIDIYGEHINKQLFDIAFPVEERVFTESELNAGDKVYSYDYHYIAELMARTMCQGIIDKKETIASMAYQYVQHSYIGCALYDYILRCGDKGTNIQWASITSCRTTPNQ